MRNVAVLCLALSVAALPVLAGEAVDDETAKAAIKEFDRNFKKLDIEEKQNAIYNLHELRNDLVIKRLEKLLRNKHPEVRNVAALALGGQLHNPDYAGKVLLKAYDKEKKNDDVLASVLDGIREVKFLGYWPKLEPALKDKRTSVVIRTLDLLGDNQDWRSLPVLLEMYKVAMPKRIKWSTGTVNVDTGTAGDADQKAAEAKFNAKYGVGGSKAKAKAKRKAKAFEERNFDAQLRRCVKSITGETFDNAYDFEEWYVENFVQVMVKIAEMEGKDVEQAKAKAKAQLPELEKKMDEERLRLEEELRKAREAEGGS